MKYIQFNSFAALKVNLNQIFVYRWANQINGISKMGYINGSTNLYIYFFFGRNFTIKHFLYSVYYVADLLHVYDDRILLAVCQNITAEFSGNFI